MSFLAVVVNTAEILSNRGNSEENPKNQQPIFNQPGQKSVHPIYKSMNDLNISYQTNEYILNDIFLIANIWRPIYYGNSGHNGENDQKLENAENGNGAAGSVFKFGLKTALRAIKFIVKA